jgi:zona occludens toxin
MAINLLTGLPGNGKTLYTISYVQAWAERENRPVFYHGIPELTLNWTKLDDPEKWYDCPANSIIVIDECQEIFRPRAASKEPPLHVSNLETHRHKGLDLWLMTQHPTLADVALRRLTQTHRHMVRMWGMQVATIHEWQGAQIDCEKESSRVRSIKNKWNFDKKAYGLYKSAEVHTVKRSVPARVIMLVFIPFILAGLVYIAVQRLKPKAPVVPVTATNAVIFPTSSGKTSATEKPVFDARADAKNYVDMHTPRLAGLAYTAPVYDEIRKPSEAPLPSACIQSKSKGCTCYSQQGTVLSVAANVCSEIVAKGFFDDSPKKSDGQKVNYSQVAAVGSVSSVASVAAGAVPVSQIAAVSGPAANAQDGYGLLGKTGQGVRHREYD